MTPLPFVVGRISYPRCLQDNSTGDRVRLPNLSPEPLITMAYTARTSTATLAPSTQTGLSARAFYVGLDVEYGCTVQHVQPPDVDVRVPDPEHLHDRHPIGLGLRGEQVLNTPISLPWCPDVCRRNSGENPGLRWK